MLGGGGVSHSLQLTTGLVIKSITTSPTLAGEHMLFILQVSILSEQIYILYIYIYIYVCMHVYSCVSVYTYLIKVFVIATYINTIIHNYMYST